MVKIHILHTGTVCVDIGVPLQQKNPIAKTGFFRSKKNRVWLPVSAYLIEHPKGLILFDTGWNTEVRNVKIKRKCFLPVSYGELPQGQAINEQLATLGYQPSDLDYVFFSHMDTDHTGGLQLVKEAKRIMVSEQEWQAVQKSRYFYRYNKKHWKGIEIETFSYTQDGTGPFGKSFDVFGDGSVKLVSTAGHSYGLSTMLIQNDGKFVALIGDTGYMAQSWQNMTLPGLTVNKANAHKSLEWVAKLSNDKNCVGLFATHDPKVCPQVIEL